MRWWIFVVVRWQVVVSRGKRLAQLPSKIQRPCAGSAPVQTLTLGGWWSARIPPPPHLTKEALSMSVSKHMEIAGKRINLLLLSFSRSVLFR